MGGTVPSMTTSHDTGADLDPALDALIGRFVAAIQAGDVDTVREIYAPDAAIWHNFDEREQTVDENVVTLTDLHRRATGLEYTEIQRFASPGGLVEQHVLIGQAKGGPLRMPAMIRFWVEDGRITRLEEYLDTRQAMVLYQG